MVETPHAGGEPAETVKAEAALAGVDGLAERPGSQEIGFLEVDGAGQPGGVAGGANLLGQAHLNQVAGFAAFDQAQSALGHEAADGLARGSAGEASTTGEPGNGEPEPEPPFETTMPQEMRIDSAVDDGETQPRDEEVLELFPDVFGVGFFVFHGSGPERARVGRLGVQKLRSLLKNIFRGHSERSEESALQRAKKKQIPRANPALGMTSSCFFQKPVRAPGAKEKARTEAGAERLRRQKGRYGLTLSFQKAESQSDPGQATRKKEKGELCEPQLAQEASYQIGGILQEIFLLVFKRENPSCQAYAKHPRSARTMVTQLYSARSGTTSGPQGRR